jgi:2-polyprenyl-6-methoxyphenol hydroxylase-like FAD-dependent oxidoreductase
MGAAKRTLIVGGGIGGLSAAIALRQRGIEVDLIEKSRANLVPGVGIILQGNALRALHALGVLDACLAAGCPFKGFTFFDAQGRNPRRLLGALTAGPHYPAMLGITRAAYSDILTQSARQTKARISYQITVKTLAQDDNGVEVTFSDGRSARYDVVVAADGIYSSIRQMIFGSSGAPCYTGQAAWRVNLPRPKEVDTLQLYESDGGRKAGLVPLRDDLMYLFLNDQTPDPSPPKDNLAARLRDRLGPFGGLISDMRDCHIHDSSEIVWKTFDVVDLPAPWHRGRVIIIGDAAHAATAHLGQGGAMASEDALVLAEELDGSDSVPVALECFMRRRYQRVHLIQEWSHQICRWEIEKTPGADPVGLTAKAFELVQQPI